MKAIRRVWLRLSIKNKLLSYFFIVIFLLSIFNLYLNNNNHQIMDRFNDMMTNYYKINALLVKINENHSHVNRYLRELNDDALNDYNLSKNEIIYLIDELYSRFSSIEAYFSLNAIKNSVETYIPLWDSAISQRKQGVETYYKDFYDGQDINDYTEIYVQDLLYTSLGEGTELYNKYVKDAAVTRQISIVLIIGVFLFALLIGALFSNYLIKPIKKLANSSIKISSGDLDVEEVHIDSEDEVGILANSFNTMSRSIRDYVEDLKQKVVIEKKLHEEEMVVMRMQQLLKDSEFQGLQSQINPHFLFNTLNTISRTAMFEEAEDTIKLIQALSNIFRYRIRNGEHMVSLKEELWVNKEYIYLQKFRYKERLLFEMDVPESLEDIRIPIFTLQPLVENAIIHGIEPKIEGGKLRIKVQRCESKTVIKITDTGIGMTKERLKEVLAFKKDKGANHRSIGVSNVYQRFKLTYQDKGHIRMLSKAGLGTMVELVIEDDQGGGKDV